MSKILASTFAVVLLALGAPSPRASAADKVEVESPGGKVLLTLSAGPDRLGYAISLAGRPAIATSPLGIVVDGRDLGQGAGLGRVETYRADEAYPTRGVHS